MEHAGSFGGQASRIFRTTHHIITKYQRGTKATSGHLYAQGPMQPCSCVSREGPHPHILASFWQEAREIGRSRLDLSISPELHPPCEAWHSSDHVYGLGHVDGMHGVQTFCGSILSSGTQCVDRTFLSKTLVCIMPRTLRSKFGRRRVADRCTHGSVRVSRYQRV